MQIKKDTFQIQKWAAIHLADFKLLPSAKPPLFHGHTVRKAVTDHLWRKKVRPFVLEQRGRKCAICGWFPKQEAETRHLHLHEVEQYDFTNKVCHLIDIQLICRKCHSFQHIIRTELVSTKEQWNDLMQHFIKVNNCPPETIEVFHLIAAKALHSEQVLHGHSLSETADQKPVRFTISPHLPHAKELTEQIAKKGLLFIPG